MAPIIFTLNPNAIIVPQKFGKVKSAIQYLRDYNMIINTDIPHVFAGNGYADIVQFIKPHPLYPALSKDVSNVHTEMVMEFWFTYEYDDTIKGYVTVYGALRRLSFNMVDLRKVLDLPQLEEYDVEVSVEEAMSIKTDVGYDTSKGIRKFQAPCVKGIWKFLMYAVTKCLVYKISSIDQANDMEIQILHSMIHGTKLDYVGIMFQVRKSKVVEDTRNSYVLYPRFLCLILEDKLRKSVTS